MYIYPCKRVGQGSKLVGVVRLVGGVCKYLVFLVGLDGAPKPPSLERGQAPADVYCITVSYGAHVACRTAGFGAGGGTAPMGLR